MKKYSLVLANIIGKINKDENLISIRPIKYFLNSNNFKENIDLGYVSREEIIKRHRYCENIYLQLIDELTIQLNKIHKVDYSIRFWEVIAGEWLKNYIYSSYKTFLEIKFVLDNYNINKIYIVDQKKYNFVVNDTINHYLAFLDEEWFFSMCSVIVEYLNVNKKIIKIYPKKNFFSNINAKESQSKIFFFKLFQLIKNFFNFDKYALIKKTYLPFVYEKILEIKLFQLPSVWPEVLVKYKKKTSIRLNLDIKIKNKKNFFENFIRHNLHRLIPKFIMENFKDILQLSNSKIFPKNPRFIFTSLSYAYDEVFKFYVANKIKLKTPYYIGQHGNNYFTTINKSYANEIRIADKFISWGYEKKPLVQKGFNFKVLGRGKSFNKNSKLLIILDAIGAVDFQLHSTYFIILKHIKDLIQIIKGLDNEIKKKTIVRLHESYYQNYFGTKYFNFFENLGVEIDKGKESIYPLLKESRLSLFSYDSTGILENFIYKHPTIFFCYKNYLNTIQKNYVKRYKNLIKNNIMFLDKEEVKNYINKNWNQIPQLWFKKKKQLALEKFNEKLNIKPDKNSLNKLKDILTKP